MHPQLSRLPRHTRFTHVGKRTLWLAAALLAAVLIALSWINGDNGTRIVLSSNAPPGPAEPAKMTHPHYQGVDNRNRPFTIIADTATQPNANTVILNHMSADMTAENGNWLVVNADQGIYNSATKQLHLAHNVDMFYGDNEFRSQEADVNVAAGTASGNLPVEGQSNGGILKADRFKVLDRGKILQFNGHVYVKLYR